MLIQLYYAISFDVGKFILFPSFLQHGVPKNETGIVRKSVSMNISFARGSLAPSKAQVRLMMAH